MEKNESRWRTPDLPPQNCLGDDGDSQLREGKHDGEKRIELWSNVTEYVL